MFLAVEPQMSGVYILPHTHGLFVPTKRCIRNRNIALRDEYAVF